MADEWIMMIVVWAVAEGIQFLRKKPFRTRMKSGAYWGVGVMTLLMLGNRHQSVPDNPIATLIFLLSSLAIAGCGALIVYWVRIGIAKLWQASK